MVPLSLESQTPESEVPGPPPWLLATIYLKSNVDAIPPYTSPFCIQIVLLLKALYVGTVVGVKVGFWIGNVVGFGDGNVVGFGDGNVVGWRDGKVVGKGVGWYVGFGWYVGLMVGLLVGDNVIAVWWRFWISVDKRSKIHSYTCYCNIIDEYSTIITKCLTNNELYSSFTRIICLT